MEGALPGGNRLNEGPSRPPPGPPTPDAKRDNRLPSRSKPLNMVGGWLLPLPWVVVGMDAAGCWVPPMAAGSGIMASTKASSMVRS